MLADREPTTTPLPLLVGESNPYGSDPEFALYPWPEDSAGGRLCRLVLGLRPAEYLRRFRRINLCDGAWSIRAARSRICELDAAGCATVLLGSKVCAAFQTPFRPFTILNGGAATRLVILPHPSGLCRQWHEPGAFERARVTLREAGVALPAESADGTF